jgi:hypothetical protein
MAFRLNRRAALLLPLLLASCGDDDEVTPPRVRRDFPPLRYGYLPPIKLNVQRMQTAEGPAPARDDEEIIGTSPVDPAETLFAMARDRLKPVGENGTATFRVLTTSITRHHDTLRGVLAVRLDVRNGDDTGYAEARVTATHAGPVTDQAAAIYDMLKTMMFDMNVELEYQIRNKLRSWVVDARAQPPRSPAPVAPAPVSPSEILPTPPPAPPPPPS